MSGPAVRRANRNWLLALGPVVAAAIGALTNLITATWNWWFFGVLAVLVGVGSAVVVLGEGWMGRRDPGQSPDTSLAEPGVPLRPAVTSAWLDVPGRSLHFIGRADLLRQLRDSLTGRGHVAALVPHALYGLGGVGKTQLAIEYAVRHAGDYDLVAWLPAEQADLLRAAYRRLADRLGIAQTDDASRTIDAVRDALRRGEPYNRWLLIFDNAEGPESVLPYLPLPYAAQTTGQVLITSRNRAWGQVAQTVEVDVLKRGESIELVRHRLPPVSERDADRLAAHVGDLPLALEQAAAWISNTGGSANEYIELLDLRMRDLLRANKPTDYPLSVAATWDLSLAMLTDSDPAAVQLLELCAFFGPEPIARDLLLLTHTVSAMPPPLAAVLADPLLLGAAFIKIGSLSLAKIDGQRHTIQLHRLVQAFLRSRLSDSDAAAMRAAAQQILAAAISGIDFLDWPIEQVTLEWIAPHFIWAGCLDSDDPKVRQIVIGQARHRFMRGDHTTCRSLCEQALQRWTPSLGPNHRQVLDLCHRLGSTLHWLGQNQQAREIDEDAYNRARQSFGADDDLTLRLASVFASDLRLAGEYWTAHDLDRATLAARAKAEAKATHYLLTAARNNLAIDLRFLGRFDEALALDQENTHLFLKSYGAEDWRTLFHAAATGCDHYYLGHYPTALEILADTTAKMNTRPSAFQFTHVVWNRWHALTLHAVGRTEQAMTVGQHALDRYRAAFGDAFAETAMMRMSLANITRAANPKQAKGMATSALADHQRLLGPAHPTTGAALNNAGIALLRAGDVRTARQHSNRAHTILSNHFGEDHWATLCAQTNLASHLSAAGEPAQALTLGQEALHRLTHTQGPNHPSTLACANNVALDLRATNQLKAARQLKATTLATLAGTLGNNHPSTVSARRHHRLDCDVEVTTF